MIETPYITQTALQHTAALHLIVPRDQISSVMGPRVQEVLAVLAAEGIAPTGPWFTHHLRRPTETFDFEICFPIAHPIPPSGRVLPGTWPSMNVARTVYSGDYSGLHAAWNQFHEWLDANNNTIAGDLWEVYLVNPSFTPDPAAWRTELNREIVSR